MYISLYHVCSVASRVAPLLLSPNIRASAPGFERLNTYTRNPISRSAIPMSRYIPRFISLSGVDGERLRADQRSAGHWQDEHTCCTGERAAAAWQHGAGHGIHALGRQQPGCQAGSGEVPRWRSQEFGWGGGVGGGE